MRKTERRLKRASDRKTIVTCVRQKKIFNNRTLIVVRRLEQGFTIAKILFQAKDRTNTIASMRQTEVSNTCNTKRRL